MMMKGKVKEGFSSRRGGGGECRSGCRKGKGGWRREDLVKGTGDLDSKRRNTRTRKAKGGGEQRQAIIPEWKHRAIGNPKLGRGNEGGRRRHNTPDWLLLLGSRYVPSPNRGSSPQHHRNTTDSCRFAVDEEKTTINRSNNK
ncbi:hypothetical protein ASPFODRAFT_531212 [Aspergillus luchuensis CBS 106.47]|uniref:Uncharacterized protein n=1 Tax=Aspergillus luchuensis (strain CBS 106.47) TaxID=1137211 RepID=A0A1M3TN11_ASPLC|nr:hypothetical protein ASPFODRAFT_531212 [Aspergillus luchuensis CBS 106.47]